MKRLDFFLIISLIIICIGFFYKTFIFGQIPFPGDLLIDQSPYKTVSFLGFAPGGYPNKAQGMDVITEIVPWKYFEIQELKASRIPFWNPHNFSGNILMQNLQSAVFDPANLFFFILPFSYGWSIFIFSQPVLASIFMYFFLRELKLHPLARIIGSISFAFSSYMTVWTEYGNIEATILWLPLLLLFALKLVTTKK